MVHYLGSLTYVCLYPDSKVHESTMGPIWDRQDPGGPHVGPMNFAIWVCSESNSTTMKHINNESENVIESYAVHCDINGL